MGVPPDSPVVAGCQLPKLAEEAVNWGMVHGALLFWFPIREQPDTSLAVKSIALAIVAAEEYLGAREVLVEVHRDNGAFFGRYNGALARIETAILALDRAMRILEQLAKRGTLPGPVSASMPSRQARKRISRLRNSIEHADEDIIANRQPGSSSSFLYGNQDKIEIAGVEATWMELARWIDQATRATRSLAMPPPRPE